MNVMFEWQKHEISVISHSIASLLGQIFDLRTSNSAGQLSAESSSTETIEGACVANQIVRFSIVGLWVTLMGDSVR